MREQSEMAAPVFSLQVYCNITTEYRLGRELRKCRRYACEDVFTIKFFNLQI